MTRRPISILFIVPSRLGDAVLASGLVKVLVEKVAGARFTIVGSALTAPLFAHVPSLERLIVMEKRSLGAHWMGLWRQVRRQRWGLVVDLRGSGLSRLLRRTRRAVYSPSRVGEHKVIEAARLIGLENEPPAPFIYTDADTDARAAALTAGSSPILAMAPAANWVGKTWPAERFATLARKLLGSGGELAGGRLMVLGSWRDRAAADPVKGAVPSSRLIDLVGDHDLLLLYAVLRQARLFVGNDSGVTHLAAAAGAPTLGLFGPSDERLYAPWGPHARAVRGPRDFTEFQAIDPGLSQQVCHMMDLSVGQALAAAQALIAATAGEAVHA
jgi:ADP-heptose:LPS heptosyltransferase